jgi:hypothetical protein
VYAVNADDAATASEKASRVFDEAAKKDLHLALVNIPSAIVSHYWPELEINRDTVACLRSCLLKPEHLDWIDKIGAILDDVAQ